MKPELFGIFMLGGLLVLLILMAFVQQKNINIGKAIGKVFVRTLVGAVMLFILNSMFSFLNFYLPINPVTAIIVGLLGLPGLASLILIKLIVL